MNIQDNKVNDDAKSNLITEIKLSINTKLYEQGYINKEMYIKAKEIIIKQI